ncbi:MAG: hypothetical protein HC906_17780 [Bacteroidales bacterium]|nr:hypothetical protein [Bacteroidales bacterium]
MQAEIIVFSNSGPIRSVQTDINPFYCELAKNTRENGSTAIGLIEEKWLSELNNGDENLEFRGIKHRKKQLAVYFGKKSEKLYS